MSLLGALSGRLFHRRGAVTSGVGWVNLISCHWLESGEGDSFANLSSPGSLRTFGGQTCVVIQEHGGI